jgi:N-hydroxyarylamine O-acetyltransferase
VDIDAYLARIGVARPARPTPGALRELQVGHLLSVPFENLDIVLGRPISLELEAIYAKVVMRRRGGYCYELNGLFAWLLEALGFTVTRLSARTVDGSEGEVGPEFDHLVLRVDLDVPWLVDVGFGDTFRTPMRLMSGSPQVDALGAAYRMEALGDDWSLRERIDRADEAFEALEALQPGQPWRTQFQFSLRPHDLADFEPMSRWQETQSPYFTQHRIVTIATLDGRRTLMDDRFIEHRAGTRTERSVDEGEVEALLRDSFGIDLGVGL